MAQHHGESPQPKRRPVKRRRPVTRTYRSRGVDVEIRESADRVDLTLDGIPVPVSIVDGEFHSQLANQFTAFETVEEIVETLLANEGRTWTLHGHVCDERCGPRGHHHEPGHQHEHSHGEHGHGGTP
jgi:hypothetical protein